MTTQQPPIATWFRDARLGIFIHYGIYAVKGVAESWSFFHGRIDKADYDAQIEGFSAANFDADQWAQLFRDAGADYAVLTTKHHDGWALWPTKVGKSTVERTGRDIVGEFVDACRRHGLRVGLYYSHLDWSHPDYASIRPVGMDPAERGNPYSHPAHDAQDPEAWQRFLQFHRAQLTELLTAYHPDLLWFDGDWERDPDQWHMGELREWLRTVSPDLVCNGRMTGGYGDYATPEQGVPVNPPQGPWELCLTMNDNWGFHHHDLNYKSTHRIARVLADTISAGGRLLLDVGPRADGTIPTEAVDRLQELGQWTAAVRPAIDAERGLPHGYFAGPTTLSATGPASIYSSSTRRGWSWCCAAWGWVSRRLACWVRIPPSATSAWGVISTTPGGTTSPCRPRRSIRCAPWLRSASTIPCSCAVNTPEIEVTCP